MSEKELNKIKIVKESFNKIHHYVHTDSAEFSDLQIFQQVLTLIQREPHLFCVDFIDKTLCIFVHIFSIYKCTYLNTIIYHTLWDRIKIISLWHRATKLNDDVS